LAHINTAGFKENFQAETEAALARVGIAPTDTNLSLGGKLVMLARTYNANIAVLLDAEQVVVLKAASERSRVSRAARLTIRTPSQPAERARGDLPTAEAAFEARSQGITAASVFTTPIADPAWKHKPVWYMVAKADHIISPKLERMYARGRRRGRWSRSPAPAIRCTDHTRARGRR
jgi:hypothetical protein